MEVRKASQFGFIEVMV